MTCMESPEANYDGEFVIDVRQRRAPRTSASSSSKGLAGRLVGTASSSLEKDQLTIRLRPRGPIGRKRFDTKGSGHASSGPALRGRETRRRDGGSACGGANRE